MAFSRYVNSSLYSFSSVIKFNLTLSQKSQLPTGATIAIFCAIQACINAGDEVIIFDPSYDSYGPSVELAGGKAVRIALQAPDFKVNWQQVKDLINDKTRMIVVNTPHNPTGTIWENRTG